MSKRCFLHYFSVGALLGLSAASAVAAGEIKVLTRPHDPYGAPRPGMGQEHVPLQTSFYLELGLSDQSAADVVLSESVAIELEPEGGKVFALLRPDRKFAAGYAGKFLPRTQGKHGAALILYIDSEHRLRPSTRYTIRVRARSRAGAELPAKAGTWQFTTEAEPKTHPLRFDLSLAGPTVRWHGGFFTGFCSPSFCTSYSNRIPTYELMDLVRRHSPRAWSLQRDFWLTGMEHRPKLLSGNQPNIVRERETRRISAIEQQGGGSLLRVEDFFGHEQYGISSGRPVSADYHPGDEVLIADGVSSARARVVSTDDKARTVLVTRLDMPPGDWKLAYTGRLPTKENPDAPGLFPPGGCYLRKFRPSGTPTYYWGRLDHEWDLDHRRFKRRLMPNFADAPGDLSIDGRDWTTAKDYVQLHEVTRAITGHIIDRYGDATLDFPWSVFNEPDLGTLFWRTDWDELQRFYDYTVDGILRAFEDRGYDSAKVFVGGLELGAIYGVHLKLREFLAHCSPRDQKIKGALPLNAAFADRRLDGKRSKRVEALCRANGGRGSPCDFVSVHAYCRSEIMAAKLVRAKEMALEIDPDYYARLWVNSHESCPGWSPPPDPAYGDSYLGNGYFPTWCADVSGRMLRRAAADPRYGFGESILTFWPWPNADFGGGNDCVRALHVKDDGKAERVVTVAMPILHFLGLLSRMGPEYLVLEEQKVGGHMVSGFASRSGDTLRVVLYTHDMLDLQARSETDFEVSLRLTGLKDKKIALQEYRFDKDHNSYYRLGRELRDRAAEVIQDPARSKVLEKALKDLQSDQPAMQLAGLTKLAGLGPLGSQAAIAVYELTERTDDAAVQRQAAATMKKIMASRGISAAAARQVQELSQLRVTGSSSHSVGADGILEVRVRVAGNGANHLVLEPSRSP
jgi:hypothetical protein